MLKHVFLLPQLFEPLMLQGLTCCDSVIRIVHQQLLDQVLNFCARMGDQLYDPCSFYCGEVELHMGGIFLEVVKQALLGRPEDIVDFMNLINFIISRK